MELNLVQGVHLQSKMKSLGEGFCINANCSYDFLLTCKGCSYVLIPAKLILFTYNQSLLKFVESLPLILAGFGF